MSFDGQWARAIAEADLVVLGPAPPLRGGIAQHTCRLVETAITAGRKVATVSFRRLYPASLFPGRSQRSAAASPEWSREGLDVLGPLSWLSVSRALAASRATVALQWWHPVTAPAYAVAVRPVPRARLVAVCHNTMPHEPVPGAAVAARVVLSRCGRVVCHSRAEGRRVAGFLGDTAAEIRTVALPCLLAEADLAARPAVPELAALDPGARLFVAAGHVRGYKATELLLRAWRRARRPAEARLLVVGESYLPGRARRVLAGLAASEESIVMVDRYVEDAELVQFLRSAEVLVAAHLHASQSGVLPIARALGLACIVSDAGGLAEQAEAGHGRGDVVRAGDEDGLLRAIERRLDSSPIEAQGSHETAGTRAAEWRRVVDAIG